LTAPVFILAGEPSGDRLAASLMRALEAGHGSQSWIGVGGPSMRAAGLDTDHRMDQLTVMGFGSALAAYPRLSKFADRLVDEIIAARPRLVITVDVKGFSLRLAARLRRRMKMVGWSAPIIHVVAPTVWAWGAWRRHRVARAVDGLLCLFPFEPDYFLPLGVKAHFIGHPEAFNPVYDEPRRPSSDDSTAPHLVILPGSRRSEIKNLLPPMLMTLNNLRETHPRITATIPTLPSMRAEIDTVLQHMPELVAGVTIDAEEGALFHALARGDAVLAASGTVTLQTALYGVPGVACYITSGLSAAIGRRLVRMDRVILPNAILGRQVYPFLFQQAATPDGMTRAMLQVLNDQDAVPRAKRHADDLRRVLRGASDSFEDNVARAFAGWLTPPQG
jgi:lipid-A-disaccharide synthase